MIKRLQQKMTVLSVALMAALLWPQPIAGFQVMSEDVIRELAKQGVTSFDLIMNVVMMGLPESLTTSILSDLQLAGTNLGGGFLSVPPNNLNAQNAQPSVPGTEGGSADQNYNSEDPIQLKRKKRFSNFFGGYDNVHSNFNFPNYDRNGPSVPENGNLYGGNANSYINHTDDGTRKSSHSFNNFFGSFHFGNNVNCPRQVDQGFVYQYSADSTTYPAIEIANELLARSLPGSDLLFQCLSRQVVFPSDPPQVFLDPFLRVSNTTCRFEEQQLWSYESVTYTGRCFPLVNFQETPFFKTCSNRFCKCKSDDFFFSNRANLCITEYETVSLYSYCERLLPNRRIVRDRILVPDACTCTSVQCASRYHRKK